MKIKISLLLIVVLLVFLILFFWQFPFNREITNPIDINKNSISNILKYHREHRYIHKLRNEWSQENLAAKFDSIINTINK